MSRILVLGTGGIWSGLDWNSIPRVPIPSAALNEKEISVLMEIGTEARLRIAEKGRILRKEDIRHGFRFGMFSKRKKKIVWGVVVGWEDPVRQRTFRYYYEGVSDRSFLRRFTYRQKYYVG